MIIENVKINNSIDCEGYQVELTGYTESIEDAINMNSFLGQELCYQQEEPCAEEFPEPIFGGAYHCPCCGELIHIEKVIYSKPAVIILWSDGTRTRSTCDKDDIWNPDLGLTLGVMKKVLGQTFVNKLFRDWAVEITGEEVATDQPIPAKTITLKDVRRNLKDYSDANTFVKQVTNN